MPELDKAQLRVRPNVADYDIPVSTFWECLSHAPRKPMSIEARKIGSGSIVVRVTTDKDLWSDFYFQLSGSNAVLRRLKNSDGSSTQNWKQLRGYVDVVGNACTESNTSQ